MSWGEVRDCCSLPMRTWDSRNKWCSLKPLRERELCVICPRWSIPVHRQLSCWWCRVGRSAVSGDSRA